MSGTLRIPVVELWNVSKNYQFGPVLEELSMVVYEGEIYGIVGDEGSGKTTLAKILSGIIYPSSGGGQVLGFDLYLDNREIRENVGYGPELIPFYEFYTIEDNLYLLAKLRKLSRREVYRVLSFADLEGKLDSKPSKLEPVEERKLSIAIALIGNPRLLVLDEPFKGLSGSEVEHVKTMIRDINRWQRKTIICTADNLRVLEGLASNYNFLEVRGRILRGRYPSLKPRPLLYPT